MNTIGYALSHINFSIPNEILTLAFKDERDIATKISSIDELITEYVIRKRVIVDSNIVGGIETTVDFSRCTINRLDQLYFIVKVPKELTGGKTIRSVKSLVAMTHYGSMLPMLNTGSSLLNTANIMKASLDSANFIQTSRMELIAENTILIHDPSINLEFGMLHCTVENDADMNNLQEPYKLAFAELCILAVKAYIYNRKVIMLDKGYIYGGYELNAVKEIIDSYSTANEEYMVYLNDKWRKMLFMNSGKNMTDIIKSMLNPGMS